MKKQAREDVREDILKLKNKAILIEIPTGYGKTINGINLCLRDNPNNILIVINRLAHIKVWEDEFKKWKLRHILNEKNVTFTTYNSLHKYAEKQWDCIIFDEAHHITPRVIDIIKAVQYDKIILLSATVKQSLKNSFRTLFKDFYCYSISMRKAIDTEVLPDPLVYLLPLKLDNTVHSELIVKNPKAKGKVIYSNWANRWSLSKQKTNPVYIYCTQAQYHQDLSGMIEWWKKKYMRTRSEAIKNTWLKLCGDRLKWLSDIKVPTVLQILKYCENQRTLTFCNSIEQTEKLGKYCINSKNSKSLEYYDKFNEGKINHITACNILNESANLVDCRIGIYTNLNSSETIILQRTGRLLRHPNPIIIIPYYIGTREQELVEKMLENYNKDLVKTVNSIKEINI